MDKEQLQANALQANAMDAHETSEQEGGMTMMPPGFSLNNGNEAPPNENETLGPDVIEELETPVSGEDQFIQSGNDDPMELTESNEKESDPMELDERQPQSSSPMAVNNEEQAGTTDNSGGSLPIQRVAKYVRKGKKKRKLLTKNGLSIRIGFKSANTRRYAYRLSKMRVRDQKELDDIIDYINNVQRGRLAPRKVREYLRKGLMLNTNTSRFVSANNKVVDHHKFNTGGFSFGNLRSQRGRKGEHEIDVRHSTFTNPISRNVSYLNSKGIEVTISPNSNGGLTKSYQSFKGNKNKPQMQSQQMLAYLAKKRKKLIAQRDLYLYGSDDYKKWQKGIIDLSELICEEASAMAFEHHSGTMTKMNAHTGNGNGKSGEFDQIYEKNGIHVAVECKGGGSSLGTRKNPNGPGHIKQGSRSYADDLINNVYKKDPKSSQRALGRNMKSAMNSNNFHYLLAKQQFDSSDDLKPHLKIKKFDM